MPDVGVLQLTIQDNSSKAATGLDNLGDALVRVKHAVTGGLGLESIANEVTKLAKTIQDAKGASSIVSKLGTMFNAINKFSQIKDFNIGADQLRDTALYMNKVADGLDRVNESRKASVSGGGAHDLYGQMVNDANTVKNVLEQTADSVEKSSHRIFNIQLFGGKGTKDIGSDIGASIPDLQKQTDDFIAVQSKIAYATEQLSDSTSSAMTSSKSSIEDATNAQIKLNDAGRAYAGVVTIFDDAEKAYKQMYVDTSIMGEALKKAIDLTQVPASGRNGAFASVAEEVTYLKQKIDDEIESQKQWISINEAAYKQLKYGGPRSKDDLQFDLKHSEEGYYAALEAEQQYKTALTDLSGYMNEYIANAKNAVQETNAQAESMQKVANATQNANDAMAKSTSAVQNVLSGTPAATVPEPAQRSPWTAEDVSNLVNYYSQVELLEMKMQSMQASLAADIEANKLDSQQIADRTIAIQNLRDRIEELRNTQEETISITQRLGDAYSSLKSGIQAMFPTITNLLKRFQGMAKMRAMRYIIRQISAGFREGVQNVYEYSKAVGTSFAPSMDQAATALQQMKNSIGAAAAPVIQALIPVLQSVVNWVIQGVNWLNQFFALINGQTQWTRALPESAKAFEKTTKAAKGSSKAMKDLLADWDELNIIQSQNSGGGGTTTGKTAEEYKNMFEEVYEFDEKIKNIVDYIKDHFEDIVRLAKIAGALILAWKVSNAFGGILEGLKTLVGGVALVITGITLSSIAGESAGMKGYYDTNDILATIGGALATALGGAMLGSMVAGVPGAIAGIVIGLAASAIVNITSFRAANKLREQKLMWGDSDYSPEQIKEYIKRSYTFDIEATINKIELITENSQISKTNLDNKITEFNNQYNLTKIKCQLEADDKDTALTDLQTSANAVIDAFNARQDSNMETIKASIELLPLVGEDGEEYTKSMIESLMVGNQSLKDYMKGLGKDIAEAYNEGIKENWGKGTEEAYLAQIDRLNKIVNQKEEYVRNKKFEQSKDNVLSGMSYDNAETAIEEIKQWNDKYIESARELLQTRYDASLETAGYWNGIIQDLSDQYTDGKIGKSEYFTRLDEARKNMETAEQAARDDLKALEDVEGYLLKNDEQFIESVNQFKEKWLEVLQSTEGYDFAKAFRESDEMYAVLMNYYKKYRNGADLDRTTEGVVRYGIATDKYEYELSPLAGGLKDQYGFKAYELMNEGNMRSLIDYFLKDLNFDADFIKGIIDNWDISNDVKNELIKILKEEVDYSTDEIPLSIEKAVKDAMEGGLTDLEVKNIEAKFDLTDSQINDILFRLHIPESSIVHSGSVGAERFTGSVLSKSSGAFTDRYDTNPSDPYASGGLIQIMQQFAETANKNADEADMSKAVASGTASANREQNELINDAIRLLRQILAKQTIVNISPSASLGIMNGAAAVMASKITGG